MNPKDRRNLTLTEDARQVDERPEPPSSPSRFAWYQGTTLVGP